MQNIQHALVGLAANDARAALYYLSRYLKQADQLDEYAKDIFEDDERSAPSEAVKEKTLAMIQVIERNEGKSAAQFDFETYGRWAAHVEELEINLQPEVSASQRERAAEFVEAIVVPDSKQL